jgi:RNA polymerase sigma-70 factor (ECF subfamily)
VDKAGLDELLDRAQRGDADALGSLVGRYSRRVFGLLYRLTGSRDVAEDLMQETFLRLVRTIGRYEHVGRFESWLFRIAANLARDRARQFGRRGEMAPLAVTSDECYGVGEPMGQGGDDPREAVETREDAKRLAASIDRLSDAEREVILLRHYSELPFREIAALLGIPLGTALARAHRALNRLRDDLADERMDA